MGPSVSIEVARGESLALMDRDVAESPGGVGVELLELGREEVKSNSKGLIPYSCIDMSLSGFCE